MTEKFTLPYERIAKIENALRNIARSFTQDQLEADDLFQEIAIRLLQMHPETTDSGLLLKARWLGIDYQKRAKTYLGHCIPEHEIAPDNNPETDVWEMTADNSLPIEEQIVRNEQTAEIMRSIANLPEKYQHTLKMLAAGKKPVEIAAAEGVSRSAITQRIAQISAALKMTINY